MSGIVPSASVGQLFRCAGSDGRRYMGGNKGGYSRINQVDRSVMLWFFVSPDRNQEYHATER